MHDLKYADEIMAAIDKKARSENRDVKGCKIVVTAYLGPFSHVTPRGLRETFAHLSGRDISKNVSLDVRTLEFELVCRSCKNISKGSKPMLECPRCKSADFDIQKGQEFVIDSVEII